MNHSQITSFLLTVSIQLNKHREAPELAISRSCRFSGDVMERHRHVIIAQLETVKESMLLPLGFHFPMKIIFIALAA